MPGGRELHDLPKRGDYFIVFFGKNAQKINMKSQLCFKEAAQKNVHLVVGGGGWWGVEGVNQEKKNQSPFEFSESL